MLVVYIGTTPFKFLCMYKQREAKLSLENAIQTKKEVTKEVKTETEDFDKNKAIQGVTNEIGLLLFLFLILLNIVLSSINIVYSYHYNSNNSYVTA